ncbi:nucleotide disphospho-sugar-binding domain-containing protein [Streptomyces vinaceus]
MRVIFTPFDYPSHYRQQVSLAWAFRAAGHDVMVTSGKWLDNAILGTGMIPVSVGDKFDIVGAYQQLDTQLENMFGRRLTTDALTGMTPEEIKQYTNVAWVPYARHASGMAGDLVELVRSWQADLIVTDPLVYASTLASQITGVPLIRNLYGPDFYRHMNAPGLSGPHEGDPRAWWPEPMVELFDNFDVALQDEYAEALVDPVPAKMQLLFESRRLPMQFVPYNGTRPAASWLRERSIRRRVCVTWGTMTGGLTSQKRFLLPDVVRSASTADAEVILAITPADAERLGELPDNVRLIGETPLHLLLSTCDAVVHQGGSGTLLTAVRYGVPQVIIPEAGDQPMNASCLGPTGAGIAITPDDVARTGDAVAELLRDSSYGDAASLLQKEMLAQPSPAEVVRTLEEIARGR